MVAALLVCLGGITAMSVQIRCMDAAREAVRLAARGDGVAALDAVRRVGPDGSRLEIRRDGPFIVARVTDRSRFPLGLNISAEALAAAEDGS